MSGDKDNRVYRPNIVITGLKTWREDKLDINIINNKKNIAATTDLLVFLLQETIVPLVRGNPGSTLG